ncbi:MAG: response regulator transcription factor [Acidobacteria bacterium]|nr:response regulator transcription factor [Acidobacteriota bacterium]
MSDVVSKILLAEDDDTISRLVSTLLTAEGHQVLSVADGSSATSALGSFNPDLVILDIMMPGKDGFAVLEDMRSADATKAVPVIMLTARDDTDSTWNGWRRGCDYYMTKPFDPDVLCATVSRLLASSEVAS